SSSRCLPLPAQARAAVQILAATLERKAAAAAHAAIRAARAPARWTTWISCHFIAGGSWFRRLSAPQLAGLHASRAGTAKSELPRARVQQMPDLLRRAQ